MKLSALLAAALQLSVGAFASNFFIYGGKATPTYDKDGLDPDASYDAFAFFPDRPDHCTTGNFDTIKVYHRSGDVSHGRQGVVCEGSGCPWGGANPDDINRLEISTDFGHFTYYKGPARELVGLDGNVYGHCYAMPFYANSIECHMGGISQGDVQTDYRGWAYFWCISDKFGMTDNSGQ